MRENIFVFFCLHQNTFTKYQYIFNKNNQNINVHSVILNLDSDSDIYPCKVWNIFQNQLDKLLINL